MFILIFVFINFQQLYCIQNAQPHRRLQFIQHQGDQTHQRTTLELLRTPHVRLRSTRQRIGNLLWLVVCINFIFLISLCVHSIFHCFRVGSDTFRRLPVFKDQRDQRNIVKLSANSRFPSINARKRIDNLMLLIVHVHCYVFLLLCFWFCWSPCISMFSGRTATPAVAVYEEARGKINQFYTVVISGAFQFRLRNARDTQW